MEDKRVLIAIGTMALLVCLLWGLGLHFFFERTKERKRFEPAYIKDVSLNRSLIVFKNLFLHVGSKYITNTMHWEGYLYLMNNDTLCQDVYAWNGSELKKVDTQCMKEEDIGIFGSGDKKVNKVGDVKKDRVKK